MKKNIYVLYDKNATTVRCDGCFTNDIDALVSFLCRLPNFSGTIQSCEVRCIGWYNSDTLDGSFADGFKTIPWSTVDFSTLPDNLINNLKLAGSIPSDEKFVTVEFIDKRLTDLENALSSLINVLGKEQKK